MVVTMCTFISPAVWGVLVVVFLQMKYKKRKLKYCRLATFIPDCVSELASYQVGRRKATETGLRDLHTCLLRVITACAETSQPASAWFLSPRLLQLCQ